MQTQAELIDATNGSGETRSVWVHGRRTVTPGRPSPRTADVAMRFGLSLAPAPATIFSPTRIPIGPGRLVLLLGPSGRGKSTALDQIDRQFIGACRVQRVEFPADAAVVDMVAPSASLDEAIGLLTCCGLGDPHLWLRRFEELSEGERFRARLARAIALQTSGAAGAPLLCDEFCSTLHRRAAKAVSFNLHKLVVRRNLSVVVACSDDDLLADLRPHAIVRFQDGGLCTVEHRRTPAVRAISFTRRLTIEPGSKRDYAAFAAMHYRSTNELGFVDKVFVLRDRAAGESLGIVVYAHGPLELALRNQATGGHFSGDPHRLNDSLRILRRLVIHPDVRGCGLGRFLVRRTLPLVGVEYVECLAAMGEFNPVFERAGMERVGQCELPERARAAIRALGELDVDLHGCEFVSEVCRSPRVREIVAGAVADWYSATSGQGQDRVPRQSPQFLARTFRSLIGSRPVYYLWRRRQRKEKMRTDKTRGVPRRGPDERHDPDRVPERSSQREVTAANASGAKRRHHPRLRRCSA